MNKTQDEAFRHAVALHQRGQLDEAVRGYQRVLEVEPGQLAALGNLGAALRGLGRFTEAENCYRQLLKQSPDNANVHYNLGNVLRSSGRNEEAIGCYRQAVALDPELDRAHYNLGNACKTLGRLQEAADSYAQAVAISPGDAKAHYNLGKTLRDSGRLEEAVKCYQQAVELEESFAEAHHNLGNALNALGHFAESVESFRQVVALRPDQALTHYNLGLAYKAVGDIERAKQCLEQALLLQPGLPEASHLLSAMQGRNTQSAPAQYIARLFDNHAPDFEMRLVMQLGYRIPSVLRIIADQLHLTQEKFAHTLDLGCGTGLAGQAFRDVTRKLTGIDLSSKMIAQAQKRQIYDALLINDLIPGMQIQDANFDLFLAADVLVYVGELLPLFQQVRLKAEPGAVFIFSTEHLEQSGYRLLASGRYAHSKAYVQSVATRSGFQLEHFSTTRLRKERSEWITGGVYILSMTDT